MMGELSVALEAHRDVAELRLVVIELAITAPPPPQKGKR
jgi:hypothetical protein